MYEDCLRWTKAFIKNSIPFNIMRDDTFRHALKSCARLGFVLPEYNKMREAYLIS